MQRGLRGFSPRAEGTLWTEIVGRLGSSEYTHWAACFWKEGFTLPELQLNADVVQFTASPPSVPAEVEMEWKCLKAEPVQLYLEEQTLGVSVHAAWGCGCSQPLSNTRCHTLDNSTKWEVRATTVYRPCDWDHGQVSQSLKSLVSKGDS